MQVGRASHIQERRIADAMRRIERRIIAESIPLDAAGLLSDAHHCRRGQLRYSIRGRPPPDPQQHELGPGQVRGLCARLHRYQRADLSPFLVVGRVIALR